ncbi:MAG: immunoglobulin [Lachnospiraceae bacterium]
MKRSLVEQETIILYNQAEQMAEVYSHDPRLLKKLAQLAEKYPEQIRQKEEHSYTVPKCCVLIREPYSEARRIAARERAKTGGYKPPKRNKDSKTE